MYRPFYAPQQNIMIKWICKYKFYARFRLSYVLSDNEKISQYSLL
jgi:hypothetical protein